MPAYDCKLIAPFVPFMAEKMWRNLATTAFGERTRASVHLCDYPPPRGGAATLQGAEELLPRMRLLRELVSIGRAARTTASLKVRQPLAKVEIILAESQRRHAAWLREHAALIAEELNVKLVEFPPKADQYVSYTVLPDLKRLGPRLGKQLPELKKSLAAADPVELLNRLDSAGKVSLTLSGGEVALDREDLQVRLTAKPGWSAASSPAGVVILATELTSELIAEGLAREFVHAIQTIRKDLALEFTDRIDVGVVTFSQELLTAISSHTQYIQGETLSVRPATVVGDEAHLPAPRNHAPPQSVSIGGFPCVVYVTVVR